jgi:hypothetical protein
MRPPRVQTILQASQRKRAGTSHVHQLESQPQLQLKLRQAIGFEAHWGCAPLNFYEGDEECIDAWARAKLGEKLKLGFGSECVARFTPNLSNRAAALRHSA